MTTAVSSLLDTANISNKDKLSKLFKEVIPRDLEDLRRVVKWGLVTYGLEIGEGSHLWYKLLIFNEQHNNSFFSQNHRDRTKQHHAGVPIAPCDYPKLLEILEPVGTEAQKFDADCKELKAQIASFHGLSGLLCGIGFGCFGFPSLTFNSTYTYCSKEVWLCLDLTRFQLPVIRLGSLVAGATPTKAERASQFCFQGAFSSEEQSLRRAFLNKPSFEPYRRSKNIGTDGELCCGDGISNSLNGISQGSFCVALRPLSDSNPMYSPNKQYGLTCCHVAIHPSKFDSFPNQLTYGGSIETPGRLDRARELYTLLKEQNRGREAASSDTVEADMEHVLDVKCAVCGTAVVGAELGCDADFDRDSIKWRKDWAIFQIAPGYTAINQPRFNDGLAGQGTVGTEVRIEKVVSRRALEGETVWKIGSASNVTKGTVAASRLLCFEKRSMTPAADFQTQKEFDGKTKEEFEALVEECSFVQVLPCDGVNFGKEGDSGGTVVRLQGETFAFEGMLAHLVHMDGVDRGEKIGLYIPADVFFGQLERKTAVRWVLDSVVS